MNVNCVIRPDNHVIFVPICFVNIRSAGPRMRVPCGTPLCHMSFNPAGSPFSEHADSAQPRIPTRPSFVRESREGQGQRLAQLSLRGGSTGSKGQLIRITCAIKI